MSYIVISVEKTHPPVQAQPLVPQASLACLFLARMATVTHKRGVIGHELGHKVTQSLVHFFPLTSRPEPYPTVALQYPHLVFALFPLVPSQVPRSFVNSDPSWKVQGGTRFAFNSLEACNFLRYELRLCGHRPLKLFLVRNGQLDPQFFPTPVTRAALQYRGLCPKFKPGSQYDPWLRSKIHLYVVKTG